MRAEQPHPQVQRILDQVDALGALPLNQYPVEQARQLMAQFRSDAEGPPLDSVSDRTIPGPDGEIPVRIYRPAGDGPLPALVYFHGGGWVLGDLDGHDLLCRHLADRSGCVVASVDYRLAPEHPFPAAVEDAYAAVEWLADHEGALDVGGGLAVAGDSAGGNLAAVVSLLARDRDGPAIDRQVLIYPSVSASEDWDSRAENAEGYFLVEEDMQWFFHLYLDSEIHARNPYAFPMNACDCSGLPPATVVTAGFDPLRDEGAAYADRLADDGVPVEHRNYDDVIHGFLNMLAEPARVDRAHEAVDDVAADLRTTFE